MPAKATKKANNKAEPKTKESKPVEEAKPVEVAPVESAKKGKGGKKAAEKKVEPVVEEAKEEVKEEVKAAPAEKKKPAKAKKVVKGKAKKVSVKKTVATKTKKSAKGKAKKIVKKKAVVPEIKLSDEKRPRYFKLLYEGKDDGTPIGRFSGNKPKQAANKALTSIIKGLGKEGNEVINVDIKFALKECTRWNKKKCKKGDNEKIEKIYHYLGKRELLKKEVEVDHIQKETDEKILKSGKVTKETTLKNGDTKYYMELKEIDAGTKKPKEIIVKKINIKDKKTKKPTGGIKWAIINEIKYKYTNKVQKFKNVEEK